jgi:RNA polymerase-binding transcription factor DksA
MASALTSVQLTELKTRLRQRFDSLREAIRGELLAADRERFQELAGRVHDPGDESMADLLVDVGLATIDRHIDELRRTEAALLAMRRGTYARCVDCGSAIDYARLSVEPAAVRCHDCQARHEQSFVQPSRATL